MKMILQRMMMATLLLLMVATMRLSAQNAGFTFQHIRNATSKITYGGVTFLVDPMLAEKGRYAGFEGSLRSEIRNPMVELPMSIKEVIAGVDAVIVTHTHLDHWDEVAVASIPKKMKIFVQDLSDQKLLQSQGFQQVEVLYESTTFRGVTIHKTHGVHGTDELYAIPAIAVLAGDAMGFVLQLEGLPVVYFAGDTVWNGNVIKAFSKHQPSYVVLNTGYAQLGGLLGSLIMGTDDILRVHQLAPKAKMIAVHMEAVNHCAVSRDDIRATAKSAGILEKVFVPADGERLSF